MAAAQSDPQLISLTTVLSLLSVVAILSTAYLLSVRLLPRSASTKLRVLFVWHAFDVLVHSTLEASYLYNCFFSSAPLPNPSVVAAGSVSRGVLHHSEPMTPPGVFFLADSQRLYGAFYGAGPTAEVWKEYARADRRWGGSDLTVISLELLTVFVMGPVAAFVCSELRKGPTAAAWFGMIVVATGELYGGFMTFAPEWLSGSPNLDTSNWMFLWLYLVFFNTLWVWLPLWILYEAFMAMSGAFAAQSAGDTAKKAN